MKKIFLSALILLTFVLSGCGGNSDAGVKNNPQTEEQTGSTEEKDVKGNLKITMLNVGQGDSFLIQTSSQNILIDTSDIDEREKLVEELDKAGVTEFDKIILTHPHADHIGGMDKLLKDDKYTVKEIFDNGVVSTSKIYLGYVKTAESKKIKLSSVSAGDTLDFGGGVKFEVLYPTKKLVDEVNDGKQKSDPNNESIVGRLVYKDFSMMFTGDAEKPVESEIWADFDAEKIRSTILKSGHHGSKTSSSDTFVETVKPEYVFISAGEPTDKRGGNTYGHPHVAALKIYLNAGIKPENILWTWKNGTVVLTSDGKKYSVKPEIKEDWVDAWIKEKQKK